MKDKILNALKSKTFFALAINIVIMVLIIGITAFSYDSADDFYNSLYICQYHNYYSNDINYIFATITGSLQYILLNFNCFVLFQILLSCAAFSSITFVFADKFGKNKAFIFTLVLNILFSFDHYSNILSSKTAALLLVAGFLMALNAIRNKRYSLPFWVGVLEVIFGTFLCFKYFFVGLAFFIAFFIGDMIAVGSADLADRITAVGNLAEYRQTVAAGFGFLNLFVVKKFKVACQLKSRAVDFNRGYFYVLIVFSHIHALKLQPFHYFG